MLHAECIHKSQVLQELFEDCAEEAGRLSGLVRRRRKLDGPRLAQIVILGWMQRPDASLADLTQTGRDLGVTLTRQAIDARLNARTVVFLAALLGESLRRLLEQQRLPVAALEQFTAVRLFDSSQISLPDSLYGDFPGNGAQGAKLKCQLMFDYLGSQIEGVELVAGRCPDQRCHLLEGGLPVGCLVVFDLGYFSQDRLAELDERGVFFETRLQSQTALYQPETGARLDLLAALQAQTAPLIEFNVLLGQRARLPVRVIAHRVVPTVAAARRRRIKRQAHKQGRTCRAAYLAGQDWDLFVTNLTPDQLSADQVLTLYRVRWQIELVFKTAKSLLHLDRCVAHRPARVLCEVYARLIALVLFYNLTAPYRVLGDRELSLPRAWSELQHRLPHLLTAIRQSWPSLAAVLAHFADDLARYALRDKRSRSPSTFQLLTRMEA